MKRSSVLEERRKRVNPEIRQSVALSFRIVDRIHDILQEKGLNSQKINTMDDLGDFIALAIAENTSARQCLSKLIIALT